MKNLTTNLFNDGLKTQLENQGLKGLENPQEPVPNNSRQIYASQLNYKEQQAIIHMLTPNFKCPKCGSRNISIQRSHKLNTIEAHYHFCKEKHCQHRFTRYEVYPQRLLALIKDGALPKDLTEQQRGDLEAMIKPRATAPELVTRKKMIYNKACVIDMRLLSVTEETLELKEVMPHNLHLDKKIIFAFKFEAKSFNEISKELAVSFSHINYCLRRHKIGHYDRYAVMAAKIVKFTQEGLKYGQIEKKLRITSATLMKIRNMFNLTKNKKKNPLEDMNLRKVESEPEVIKVVAPKCSEKETILSSVDFSEIEKIYKSTNDPKVKELAKQKLKLIFECL